MKWKKARQFLLGALALLVITGIWISYANHQAFDNICRNQILSESFSPDQTYRVVVFQRDCGATTGFSTQVSVLKVMEILPNESGNLFIADTDHGKAPSGMGGGPEVKISWVGSRSVHLTHHKNARIFFSNLHVLEVSATYDSFK
jgi:Family of unknown function (DUF5412)